MTEGVGIQFGSAEAIKKYDEKKLQEREAERAKRISEMLPHVEISLKVFSRVLSETPHHPRTALEVAIVALELEKQGWYNLGEDVRKIMADIKMKDQAKEETRRQAQLETQKREQELRDVPEKRILSQWKNHNLDAIEAMSLNDLEAGAETIRVLWQKRGLVLHDDEYHSLSTLLHNIINQKKQQPQPQHTKEKKKQRFGIF